MTSKKPTLNVTMIGDKFATVICIQNCTQLYVVEEHVLNDKNGLDRVLKLYNGDKQYIKTIHANAIEKFGMDNIFLSIGNCYDYTTVISYCTFINHIASNEYGLNK